MHPKTSIETLLTSLKNNAKPNQAHKTELKVNAEQLRGQLIHCHRHPWRAIGKVNSVPQVNRLQSKQLNNWEIHRINFADRSFKHPKFVKPLRIPSTGRNFSNFTSNQIKGHLPFLYESDCAKIDKLRQNIHQNMFHRTNTMRNQFFGFKSKGSTQSMLNRKNKTKFQ